MTQFSDMGLMDRLERDISRLLAKNKELREENHKLTGQNERLAETVAELKTKVSEQEEQIDQLLLKKSVTEVSGGTKAAKLRINRLIREVDRCIALMNK